MATSVTAISEPFSPTTATVSQPSGTAGGGAGPFSIFGSNTSNSYSPSGGASGSSSGTTTQTLSCSPCCAAPVLYLPGWFSSSGLCPGIAGTSPVYLTATITMAGFGGYSLANLCLPTSASFDVVANNRFDPTRLYLLSESSSCSSVSPPTTRFNIKTGRGDKSPFYFSYSGGISGFSLAACDCSGNFNIGFVGLAYYTETPIPLASYSCSPFSATYSSGSIIQNWVKKGTWDITFTL